MLLPNRLTLMQRVQDAVGHGYHHYFVGSVAPAKWEKLALKFAREYQTEIPRSTRSKRRRAGEAVVMAYACPPWRGAAEVSFMLLVTDGAGRVHARETLTDLRQRRLELDGYELVHDGVGWSWQMTASRYRYWRERIHATAALPPGKRQWAEKADGGAVIRYDPQAEDILDALYHAPGFRLVRRQVGKLVAYLVSEWRRLRPATDPQPRPREFLPYIQRLPNRSDK